MEGEKNGAAAGKWIVLSLVIPEMFKHLLICRMFWKLLIRFRIRSFYNALFGVN